MLYRGSDAYGGILSSHLPSLARQFGFPIVACLINLRFSLAKRRHHRNLVSRPVWETPQRPMSAFTLVELMVVIGLMTLLLALMIPALNPLKTAADLTSAGYRINGALQQGRAFAMANNTYVWVGFYEENSGASTPTNTVPPYAGRGRVVIGSVAATDGTKIFNDSDPVAALPTNRIIPVGKIIKLEGVHLQDIGEPPGGPTDGLDGRPPGAYTDGKADGWDHFNRISSESADTTRFRFSMQNYTFYKTVRFSPRGEANINSTYSLKRTAEIGMRPTHGTAVDTNTLNVVAIQFSGIAGNFKMYRR